MNYKKFVNFILESGKLKWVKRSGWVREKMPEPETVAEHSWRVALLALVLGEELGLDSSRLVKMAILHDIEEVKTNDPVTQRGKGEVGKHDHIAEREIVKDLLAGIPDSEKLYSFWQAHIPESGPGKDEYSDILYQLGKLATCWQALEYELRGADKNKCQEWWDNAYAYVSNPIIKGILKEMEKLRK